MTGSDAHRLVRSRFFEVENTEAIWQAPETEADDARAFFVTPDAAAVVWHYRSAAGTDTVQVIDVATEKLGLAHVAADELALVRADGAGHLALVDYPPNATPQPGSKVRVLDLGAARAGSAQDVFAEVTLPHRLFRGVVAAGKLFASVEDALGVQLLDLGTGGLSESPTEIAIDLRLGLSGSDLNTAGRVSLAASPSARRLWALSASAGEVRLLSQKVDPETGTFGEQDQLVPVTPGAVEFYAYSDGENVIVLDAKGDQLLLLE